MFVEHGKGVSIIRDGAIIMIGSWRVYPKGIINTNSRIRRLYVLPIFSYRAKRRAYR